MGEKRSVSDKDSKLGGSVSRFMKNSGNQLSVRVIILEAASEEPFERLYFPKQKYASANRVIRRKEKAVRRLAQNYRIAHTFRLNDTN